MYINHTMAGYIPEEGIRSALKHGTVVIGQLGLAETLQLLIGKNHLTEEGMELAKRIEQLFKDRVAEYKQKYKLNFGVYFTPAENLCYTALKKFRDKYGVIENVVMLSMPGLSVMSIPSSSSFLAYLRMRIVPSSSLNRVRMSSEPSASASS